MKAERQAEVDYLKELFSIDDRTARQIIRGTAFFYPLTGNIVPKSRLLSYNYRVKMEKIRQWIEDAQNRSSYDPGYDERTRYFIEYAEISENLIMHHLKLQLAKE